jgi:hypothetical protein
VRLVGQVLCVCVWGGGGGGVCFGRVVSREGMKSHVPGYSCCGSGESGNEMCTL